MKRWTKLRAWMVALVAALAVVVGGIGIAIAADDPAPDHHKSISNNNDGTYTLALNVTGESVKKTPKVNVIVIVDRSGSMDTQSGTGAYVPTNGTGTGLYGFVDGQYVQLERRGTPGNRTFWYNGVQYTGQRYQYDSTATRLQATQAAVNGLANELLGYNTADGADPDTVQMALVTFATNAQTNVDPTTSYSTFSSAVNGLSANGGTNWEAALRQANGVSFNDDDPTFVIFFSDGSPTFHSSNGGYNNWNDTYNVYGSGQEQEPNMERSYTQAIDDAETLATKVGVNNFYTIFAYGTTVGAGYMADLTEAAGAPEEHNYSASSTAELNDAFAEILEKIQIAGFADIEIEDGTTNQVAVGSSTVELLEVDEGSYRYWRAGGTNDDGSEKYDSDANTIKTMDGATQNLGVEWKSTDEPAPPAAQLVDGKVEWDLTSLGVLENGVTYTVTFDVYPSQYTYDLIADLENGKPYAELPEQVRKYLSEDGRLITNTDTSLKWKDTRDESTGETQFNELDPVPTAVSEMQVTKVWFNDLDWRGSGQYKDGFDLEVKRDSTVCETVTVKPEDWTDSIYISTGLMRAFKDSSGNITGIQVLDTGHDYTIVEPENLAYQWELVVETIHPMLINGELTTLVQVLDADVPEGMGDADFYTLEGVNFYRIDGKVYKENGMGDQASVSAYNERKSNLNISKVVEGDAPEGAFFTYDLSLTDPNGDDLWFSVVTDPNDPDNTIVKDLETTATAEDGDTGYYYFPSGSTVTVKMQEGWNLRVTNLPTGTTYMVEESEAMDAGFQFDSVNGDSTITVSELPDGAVDLGGGQYSYNGIVYTGNETDGYTYTYTPTISGMKGEGTIVAPNASYQVAYTNVYPKTKLTVDKVWDGTPAESATVQLLANGEASGDPVTLSEDNDWTHTFTNLEVLENGSIITYTVEETAPTTGYSTTYAGTANAVVSVAGATAGQVVEVTVGDKTATATADDSGNATVTVEGVEYVSETGEAKTLTATSSSGTATITAIEERAITITNQETGDLEVTKTVESDLAADADVEFEFTVTLSDTTISGTYGDMTFANGVATFTLKDGESATAEALPAGITYTVEETADNGFETTKTGENGTVNSTSVSTAAFTNTRKTGDLDVTKTVTSSTGADKQKDFTFTVTLSDTTISGEYGDATFENGVATFTLKDGETKSITGLPQSVEYTVEEDTAEGFVTTKTGDTGTISADKATAAFTNTRDEGGLVVSKSVVSDVEADKDKDFTFTVTLSDETINETYGEGDAAVTFENGVATFTLKDGDTKSITGLPTGLTYTVAEEAEADFETTKTGDTGTISDTASTAEFTNTRKTGEVTISKEVVSDLAADKDATFSFTVTLKHGEQPISGTYSDVTFDEDGKGTITLKGGESKTIEGLPVGASYTVTEEAEADFETAKTGDTGTITGNETAEAAFTNTRETGDLELSKTVVSDLAADADQSFAFTVTLSDTTISGTYGDMTFADGVATVTLKGGESATAKGLPTTVGYTITEAEVSGFANTEKTGDTGTIQADETASASFTNTREVGDLTVSKSVTSSTASDRQKDFEFTVTLGDTTINGTYGDMTFTNGVATFTLKDGESATAKGLPTTVSYTVTETADDAFVTTTAGDTGSISTTESTADFTNVKKEGGLVVIKTVKSDLAADADTDFEFTVTLSDTTISGTYGDMTFADGVATFTLKGGESVSAAGLPNGVAYTVVETTADGFVTTKTGDTGTIAENETAEAAFTNTRKVGDLELSKVLVSDKAADADQSFTFTVTLSDTTISGTYGDMTFADGVATVTLKGGESATATGLPTSATYIITEDEADGFELTAKTGDTGTIQADETTSASFTNTRETGDLELSKVVVSDAAADADVEFTFTVTLSDETISGAYGDMNFEGGVATVTLKGGEKATATGLPTSVTYTITEAEADGFTNTEKTGDTGTITTTKATASFTNTRVTSGLAVTKTVSSIFESDDDVEFEFTVTLGDETISGEYGDMTFENGVASFTLKNGESAVADGLPTGVTYTVTETANAAFATTKTGDTGTIAEGEAATAAFTNTRILTEVPVTKIWDDEKYFENGEPVEGYERPEVVINLLADNETVATHTLTGETAADVTEWTYTFTDLPKYDVTDGHEIVYTVTEDEAAGYGTGVDGTVVTNTPQDEDVLNPVALTINKIDSVTENGLEGVVFTLTGGTLDEGREYTTNADGEIVIEFKQGDLEDGTYTLTETVPTGYTADSASWTIVVERDFIRVELNEEKSVWQWIYDLIFGSDTELLFDEGTNTLTVPNTPIPTKVSVDKVWDDNENKDEVRPTELTYTLTGTAGGEEVYTDTQTVTVEDDGSASYVWEDLVTYHDGQPVTYDVTEADVENYTTTVVNGGNAEDGFTFTFTNTHTDSEKDVFSFDATTSVDGELVGAGEILTYTITYANNTGGVATVTVEDTIPSNTTFEKNMTTGDNITFTEGDTLKWEIANVPAGATGTVSFQVKVDDAAKDVTIKNEAIVSDGENENHTNAVTTSVPVKDVKNESGESIDNAGVQVGDTLTYEVKFTITEDAESVVVTDKVPDNTTLVDGSIDNGGTESDGVITWDLGALPADDYTVSFQVTVDESAVNADTITNTASISVNDHPAVETNVVTNTPEIGGLTVSKTVVVPEGYTIDEDKAFTFTIELTDKNGTPLTGSYAYTGPAEGQSGKLSDNSEFSLKHGESIVVEGLPAGAKYTIVEAAEDGYNGGQETTIAGTIPEPGDDGEPASVEAAFENVYKVEKTGIVLGASKKLEVEEPANNAPDVSGEYTFTLKEGDEVIDTKTNPDGEGTAVSFAEISYDKPGEHQYTITETGKVDGVTNGQESYTVKVNVSDQGDGTLKAEVTEGSQVTAFTNTYKVNPTKANFEVLKEIKGTPLTAGAFEFELKDANEELVQTKTNKADGKVTFDEIPFNEPGTFTYTITEVNGGSTIDGTTYSGETVTVTVDVTDNGKGELVADVSYDPEDPTFKNTYEADGDVELSVSKELTGRKLEDGQFTFELVDEDDNVIQTKTNNASGAVQFDSIPYNQDDFDDQATNDEATTDDSGTDDSATDETEEETTGGQSEATTDEASEGEAGDATTGDAKADEAEAAADEAETDEAADAERTATFKYVIREVAGDAPGYTYDTHEVNVTVTVVDNGDGTLTATPVYDGSTEYVNTYEAEGEAQFEGIKTTTGKDLADGQFEFQLKDSDGNVIETVTNGVDGSFSFSPVTYKQNAEQTDADTGTFKYTIVEVNDGQTGWTYDSHVCDVTVTVTDNGNGTLATTVEYSDGEKATFNNPYKPLATSAPVTAKKVLEGRDLKAGEFTFELRDAEGKVVATATNAASGLVDFGYVSFDEVGTYTFTATEVKGTDANVTYDSSTKTYTVEVVDDDGQLVATVTCDDPSATFTNVYKKPDVPGKPGKPRKKVVIPQTGDDTPTGAMAALTVFGAAALTAGTVLQRRKRK